MDAASAALGAQAAAAVAAAAPGDPSSSPLLLDAVLCQARELTASSSTNLRQHAFLTAACLSPQQQQSPQQVVQLAARLLVPLFGLQVLQQIFPAPEQAASAITHAALADKQPLRQPVLQLLQALLTHAFDAAAVAAADSSSYAAAAWPGLQQQAAACVDTAGLQQYVASVLQLLQDAAAAEHEVLAVCLAHAAASCRVLCDSQTVTSWMTRLLQRQVQACVCRPPPANPAARGIPGASATPVSSSALPAPHSSWPCLALQPLCWTLLMPAVLQCMQLDAVLSLLSEHLVAAAGSVTGIMRMCDMLAALAACGHADAVVALLSDSLAAALTAGDAHSALPPLLLAAHLRLSCEHWGKAQYQALLHRAGAVCHSGHAATALPVLLKALNLLLPTADTEALQVHVELLQQLRTHVGPVLLAEVSSAAGTLKDVLLQKQLMHKQEQQGRQGGKLIERAALDGYQLFLDQFIAHGRRPLAPVDVAKWRLMRGAQDFCDCFTQQPPDTLDRAQACLSYIEELQAHKLCKADQAAAFKSACLVFGLDLSAAGLGAGSAGGSSRVNSNNTAAASTAATTPVATLKALLDRLPVVVGAGSKPGLTSLLSRLSQQLQGCVRQGPTSNRQQQQQEQHPAKKQRLQLQQPPPAAAAAHSAEETCAQVLGQLLSAYTAASSAAGSAAAGWDWRVQFLGVLEQGPRDLHTHLLQRLLGSLHGTAWAPEAAPQQALWHGSLLAWLSASKPHQLPLLAGSDAGAAVVTTAGTAAPLFTWHCGSSSSGSSGMADADARRAAAGRLQGLQLVQHLLGHTSLDSVHLRCCAASFWAGYVGCIKTSLSQWCAGPHGPFGSTASAGCSPSMLTAETQQPATAALDQQLIAYVPPQLAVLLRQLVSDLSADVQQAVGGEAAAVAASALQVCTRALRTQPLKWVCQRYGV